MNISATFTAYFLCFLIFCVAPTLAYLAGLDRGRKEQLRHNEKMWWNGAEDATHYFHNSYDHIIDKDVNDLWADYVESHA